MSTLLESLQGSLRRAARHNPGDAVQPAAVLWTEPDRQWRVAGLELFDNETTQSKTLEKLVGSFAMDALEIRADKPQAPQENAVKAFLDRLGQAQVTEHPAVDLGTDLRLSGKQLVGGALVVDGRIVHLSAYNLAEPDAEVDREEAVV